MFKGDLRRDKPETIKQNWNNTDLNHEEEYTDLIKGKYEKEKRLSLGKKYLMSATSSKKNSVRNSNNVSKHVTPQKIDVVQEAMKRLKHEDKHEEEVNKFED